MGARRAFVIPFIRDHRDGTAVADGHPDKWHRDFRQTASRSAIRKVGEKALEASRSTRRHNPDVTPAFCIPLDSQTTLAQGRPLDSQTTLAQGRPLDSSR